MKTTNSIFTKVILGLAIAGTFAACNSKPASTTTTAANTTPPPADKNPIVYVNSDTLYAKYEYAKDVNKILSDKGKAAQSDATSKEQAFQREVADYQKAMTTLSADQRQTTEQRLGREKQELQQYEQNAGAQYQNEQGTQARKLYDKIADFCKAYANEKGYKMILTYSKTNPTVLYGDATLDVTGDVVKRLNDAYAKEKK